jgi:hypothetical protein
VERRPVEEAPVVVGRNGWRLTCQGTHVSHSFSSTKREGWLSPASWSPRVSVGSCWETRCKPGRQRLLQRPSALALECGILKRQSDQLSPRNMSLCRLPAILFASIHGGANADRTHPLSVSCWFPPCLFSLLLFSQMQRPHFDSKPQCFDVRQHRLMRLRPISRFSTADSVFAVPTYTSRSKYTTL